MQHSYNVDSSSQQIRSLSKLMLILSQVKFRLHIRHR